MSEENVEVVRRVFENFLKGMEIGEPGAFADSELLADDWEWIMANEFEGRSVWRGREGFIEFIRTWTAEFDDWSIRLERLIDGGEDKVVGFTVQSARGKGSGVPVELNVGGVFEFEEGRVIRVTNYPSHAEALEAAGLSE